MVHRSGVRLRRNTAFIDAVETVYIEALIRGDGRTIRASELKKAAEKLLTAKTKRTGEFTEKDIVQKVIEQAEKDGHKVLKS